MSVVHKNTLESSDGCDKGSQEITREDNNFVGLWL